jgi:hypothetical protein
MSYTPILIILKEDLDKQKDYILSGNWQYEDTTNLDKNEDGHTVMGYINDVYKRHNIVFIKDIEVKMCTPEYSSFSQAVRNKLDELNIR